MSKKDVEIIDIYWERIYLHIKLRGDSLQNREYVVATEKEKYLYPLEFHSDRNELIINITNVHNQNMLGNGKWYVKYLNENYEEEMKQYESGDENTPDSVPRLWLNIPVEINTCYKLSELDKIYRYSGNNYAYIFSFKPQKKDDDLICVIESTFMVKNMKPEKRYFEAESSKKEKQFVKRLIFMLEKFLNVIYQIVSHLTPKDGTRVLLMSETRSMGGNLKVLDDRIKERGLDKQFQVRYHFEKTLEMSRKRIFFVWLKLAFLTARQDYIFVDDYVPFFKYIKVHPKTTLVQVWHAGVGFKSVGYARFGVKGSPYPFDSAHRKYDYAIVGGEALQDVYAEVFGIDKEQCLPYGLMRNDGYLDQNKIDEFKKQFYLQYPELKNKKVIMFAPTFRGTGQRDAFYPYEVLEQEKIYNMCGEEYVFMVKMHPFVLEKLEIEEKFKDRILDFSDFSDINQLFYVTDILITDYSSNIYEFSMMKKPIISFAYDKDEYELIRSVHRTLDKYAPGKFCTTIDDVIETIQNKDFEMEKLQKFVEENFDNSGGNAADRVIDHILLRKDVEDTKEFNDNGRV